jgi:hypothetical protein
MRTRSVRSDDRAIGVQIILAIVALIAFSLLFSILFGPAQTVKDYGQEQAEGTEFEGSADKGLGFAWDAFRALPKVAALLATVFVIVSAVVLSARGI